MSYEQELHAQGLCAEVVPVMTEDGPATGRCRRPVEDPNGDDFAQVCCPGHAEEMRSWRGMSELQRAMWERAHDESSFGGYR